MADATLASNNAALVVALLQAQNQNQVALGPTLLDHQIGVGQGSNAWVRGSNKPEYSRYRPEPILARQLTYFKKASVIVKAATSGLPGDFCLVNDKKTYKITLAAWVNSLRGYLEERVLDTVF